VPPCLRVKKDARNTAPEELADPFEPRRRRDAEKTKSFSISLPSPRFKFFDHGKPSAGRGSTVFDPELDSTDFDELSRIELIEVSRIELIEVSRIELIEVRQGSLAPPELPGITATTTPSDSSHPRRMIMCFHPPPRLPAGVRGLWSSRFCLSARAVPFDPEEPNGCTYPLLLR